MNENNLMTFEQYLSNPTKHKGNLVMNLSAIRNDLNRRYDKLIEEKKNKFKINVYKEKDKIIIHVIEPSESYDMNYDIIFEINKMSDEDSLEKYPFKVFSNCPSFAFTFAFVFSNNGLLIEELKEKFSKEVFNKNPYQRNYYEMISYEKSIYFAIQYLLDNYDTIDDLLEKSESFSNKVFKNIDTVDKKISENKKLKHKESLKRKKEKRKENLKEKDKNALQDNKKDKTNSTELKDHRIKPKSKIKGTEHTKHSSEYKNHRVKPKGKIKHTKHSRK